MSNKLLPCISCKEQKKPEDFPPFSRNPVLKATRSGRASICRECATKYIVENGNTKKALREILIQMDIPYVEKIADISLKIYNEKKANDKFGLQTTLLNAYMSKSGLIEKGRINASFSDGIISLEQEDKMDKELGIFAEKSNKKTEVQKAEDGLRTRFGEIIYADKEKLAKAIKLKVDSLNLCLSNTNTRQEKFKITGFVKTLVENNMLDGEEYAWLIDKDYDEVKAIKKAKQKDFKFELPEDFDIESMTDKWGYGYTPEELYRFEKKFQLLKNNYPERTALHTEALVTYVRYRVKEEVATAKGDVKEAKEWGSLASKASQDGKLNISQLSKSDLSNGLDTFGQLVRAVETAVDVIPILPKFKQRPQDAIDFTLLCYVNYVRDLKGLPPAEYSDIYKFYEDRKKEYDEKLSTDEVEEGEDFNGI